MRAVLAGIAQPGHSSAGAMRLGDVAGLRSCPAGSACGAARPAFRAGMSFDVGSRSCL